MLESKWSAHDVTNAIISACGVSAVAYPNSLEEWGLAQRKVIYSMWMAHIKANRANHTLPPPPLILCSLSDILFMICVFS